MEHEYYKKRNKNIRSIIIALVSYRRIYYIICEKISIHILYYLFISNTLLQVWYINIHTAWFICIFDIFQQFMNNLLMQYNLFIDLNHWNISLVLSSIT